MTVFQKYCCFSKVKGLYQSISGDSFRDASSGNEKPAWCPSMQFDAVCKTT